MDNREFREDLPETLAKIKSKTAEEKLMLIRKALYSDEHMLKVMVKILIIADPEAVDDVVLWLESRKS